MKKELELWQFILSKLRGEERVVLLLVVSSTGSSPGRPGFKMAVTESDMSGSIGGGVMEVALVERAHAILKDKGTPERMPVRQVHRKNSPDPSGMICSGEQRVLLRILDSRDMAAVEEIAQAVLNEKGSLEIDAESIRVTGSTADSSFEILGEADFSYGESLSSDKQLFIIGGGHCCLALSEIMSRLDFRITVFDDRPNLNTLEKNSFAHRVTIIDDYSSIAEAVPSGSSNYVVVMTIGYKYDKVVVRELLSKEFKYFGVLGSKAKMAVLLRELREEGCDEQKLAQIHTPIGIGINSRTPAEIAVSIAAEIIQVKNKGEGK